jgi:uncharacterized Ntn-hydrolase superfamily protein
MTWSIVARDPSGALGIAIASRFFAVGALCPHGRSGVGALATQALVNPLYAQRGLDALSRGETPAAVIHALTAEDAGRDHRQLHMIDAAGRVAAHTGSACIDWCGHLAGDGWSIAGNMLAGPQVLEQTATAYMANARLPFAECLIAAMQAGEAAGGDKRGKQGAALLIYTTEDYASLDLRVDDHVEPLGELRRLHEKSLERFQPFVSCLPSRRRPAGITNRNEIEDVVTRFQLARRSVRS